MIRKTETVVFGGGCFWCTEAIFQMLRGVISVTPGYAGGKIPDPTYELVSSGGTGHAEVVKIDFDPEIIPYRDLLDIFLHTHDPTTPDRQGADVGTQYRSLILYTTDTQKKMAENALDKSMVTEIKPLENFYPAEDYHRNYYANHQTAPYCQLIISPKLKHLREKYSTRLNTS
jgi:peptide-methionine (S)-S-oxide reductase